MAPGVAKSFTFFAKAAIVITRFGTIAVLMTLTSKHRNRFRMASYTYFFVSRNIIDSQEIVFANIEFLSFESSDYNAFFGTELE